MSVAAGEAYWVASPLPGEPSGGAHTSVVLSCAAYNGRTGFPVVAAMRKQPANAYRIEVSPSAFTSAVGQPPLDEARVIGLDQCRGATSAELSSKHGDVDSASLSAVLRNVPAQFQLGAAQYARRGEMWSLAQPVNGVTEIVIVLNDRAVRTADMSQILALPVGAEGPLLMVAKSNLAVLTGQLDASGQVQLDSTIRGIFGI